MKKTILPLIACATLGACTSVDKLTSPTSGEYQANPEGYVLMENTRTKSVSNTVYFLFIPFGGKGDGTMQNECYNDMLKNTSADGVFNATYMITRKRYPFFGKTVMELSGRPYKLKAK